MCLKTTNSNPRVAEKPITCYKIVRHKDDGKYVTGYMQYPVPDEVINGEIPMMPESEEPQIAFKAEITGGVIHAFQNKKDCEWFYNDSEIFECEIPEGSLYWIGDSNDLCANRLVFKKNIEKNLPMPQFSEMKELGPVAEENKEKVTKLWERYFLSDACQLPSKYSETLTDEKLFFCLQNVLASEYCPDIDTWKNFMENVVIYAYHLTKSEECAADAPYIMKVYQCYADIEKNINPAVMMEDYILYFLLKKHGFDTSATKIGVLLNKMSILHSNLEEFKKFIQAN